MVLKVFEWIVECDGIVMKCFELYESVKCVLVFVEVCKV